MKKILLIAFLAAAGYLLAWPTPINPVVWTPPPPVPATGIYAPNNILKDVQRIGVGVGKGPEGIAVDAVGRVYAGYDDGRIVMFAPNGSSYQELAKSKHGRPLGITFGPNGGLVVADAEKGLLAVGSSDKPKRLVRELDGKRFALVDDADNTRLDKNIYFTDASKYPLKHVLWDFIEHAGTGRLLVYNVTDKTTKVLMDGLYFANGVAVGPDDAYVLVNETGMSRIQRYWLTGEKAGTHDIFAENLPGMPDNLSYDYDNHVFWVALFAPRSPDLENLAGKPAWLKKIVARLPAFLQPAPAKKSWVLGLSTEGKVVYNLQYEGKDGYAPITSVEAWGPWLYFGSLTEDGIGRIPLNKIIPGAQPPPAGWENTPSTPHHFKPPVSDEQKREMEEEEEREKAMAKAKGEKIDADEDDEDEDEEKEKAEKAAKATPAPAPSAAPAPAIQKPVMAPAPEPIAEPLIPTPPPTK